MYSVWGVIDGSITLLSFFNTVSYFNLSTLSLHFMYSMKDKYRNNCPVCREDMFSSRQSPQDLPCGHAIHAHCFRNLAGFDYR